MRGGRLTHNLPSPPVNVAPIKPANKRDRLFRIRDRVQKLAVVGRASWEGERPREPFPHHAPLQGLAAWSALFKAPPDPGKLKPARQTFSRALQHKRPTHSNCKNAWGVHSESLRECGTAAPGCVLQCTTCSVPQTGTAAAAMPHLPGDAFTSSQTSPHCHGLGPRDNGAILLLLRPIPSRGE